MSTGDPTVHGRALARLGASKGGKARAANLTAEERNQVGDWLHQKKDKFQSKVVEQLHKLHKVDDNQL